MDTFKYDEMEKDDQWFFTCVLAAIGKDHPAFANWKPGMPINVEMKVNGADVPFRAGVKRMMQEHHRMVKEQAAELMEEKSADWLKQVSEAAKGLSQAITEKRKQLFPDVKLDEDDYGTR